MVRIFFIWLTGIISLVLLLPLAATSLNFSNNANPAGTDNVPVEVTLYLHKTGKLLKLPLDEYIAGVVSAEMPAEFPLEALKAQAVAARTYTVRNMRQFGGAGVSGSAADLSDDAKLNQAWLSSAELKTRWGSNYSKYTAKIRQAVEATSQQIICYDNKPISAVFHAASSGRTASAAEVWGSSDYPYLQSVKAPEKPTDERITRAKIIELADALAQAGEEAVVVNTGDGEPIVVDSYTESGRVAAVRVNDKLVSGTKARELWGLRSDNFSISYDGDKITFTTYGYGHGVGLSQYGAAALAEQGWAHDAILGYFYTGTSLNTVQSLIKDH